MDKEFKNHSRGKLIGLDISTSITGWTVLSLDDGSVEDMGYIDLRKLKNLWLKTDKSILELSELTKKYNIQHIFVEESLQMFRSGMSSSKTLSTLAKFNGLLSYGVRNLAEQEPQYLSASSARKTCGIQVRRGPDQLPAKKQAFKWVTEKLKKDWPVTKKGNIQQYCYDQADSFVIATAGWLQLNCNVNS
jgi:hypothetical protein